MSISNIELHVHPFLGKNSITDVVQAMEETNIDVIALEALNASIYPQLVEECRTLFYAGHDKAGIKIPDGKYILNAREYDTKENIHVLTVGYSYDDAKKDTEIRKVIDRGLENDALVIIDHPFVDNGRTKTAGHISSEKEMLLENLCIEYSGKIALEWNAYCIPRMRKMLRVGLNVLGFDVKYHDVNQKAKELSESMKSGGYDIPVIADTDLHARSARHLKYIGTARIITEIEGESASEIVSSLEKNIFERKYTNVEEYVSSAHLVECFCLPILLPFVFKKPRA